jgi:predicted 3-demethylubiquinone-9 3-methyltransferase (glyoxalase superfamily)
VVPDEMIRLLNDPDPQKAARVIAAIMQMKKLDLNELRRVLK